MVTLTLLPLTCWVCVLVAIPRAPRPGDEVQELVYRRLVGRHDLLLICAIAITLAALLVVACRAAADML